MSKKAIEILKSKMTLDERKEFVRECERQNGKDWYMGLDGFNIWHLFMVKSNSFSWEESEKGLNYWNKIRNRFTDEEESTVINLNEFKNGR
jgi:hypothetical protein